MLDGGIAQSMGKGQIGSGGRIRKRDGVDNERFPGDVPAVPDLMVDAGMGGGQGAGRAPHRGAEGKDEETYAAAPEDRPPCRQIGTGRNKIGIGWKQKRTDSGRIVKNMVFSSALRKIVGLRLYQATFARFRPRQGEMICFRTFAALSGKNLLPRITFVRSG